MTVWDWIKESRNRFQNQPLQSALSNTQYEFRLGIARRVNYLYPAGDYIFDRDWDLLIVLDACRCDVINEVKSEYAFLQNKRPFISRGSTSEEWMNENFVPCFADQMKNTAYVTGNLFTEYAVPSGTFGYLDEVWKYAWSDDHGTVLAESITDRAIRANRNEDPDRLIVHYMQPHFPSVPDRIGDKMSQNVRGESSWRSATEYLQHGELPFERVWEAYRSNLRYVLDNVETLLKNVQAGTAVITADHGELFGEWGLYAHPHSLPVPEVRKVPWYETTGRDEETYSPTLTAEMESGDIETKLRALGYME